jgi:hypothetical protein
VASGIKSGISSATSSCMPSEIGAAPTNHQMLFDFFDQPANCA